MANVNEVANYIVRAFQEAGDPVSNLKLQKLLYYVQGWHLALNQGRPAFNSDFQAWVHGPVCPEVYHAFKGYRWHPIVDEVAQPHIEPELEEHIKEVLAEYGGETGWALEQRTHLEDPWLNARGELPPDAECRSVISRDSMRDFFSTLAEAA
jgi:uncharacterized phage-associated protein